VNTCTGCISGQYCPDGLTVESCGSVAGTSSPPLSTSVSSCSCSSGYYGHDGVIDSCTGMLCIYISLLSQHLLSHTFSLTT
jgi:hypothetical protein